MTMRAFARTKEVYDRNGVTDTPPSVMLDWIIEMDFDLAKSGDES